MGDGRPGAFEQYVLLAAMRLGPEEAYAVSIADDITTRTGRPVRRANVYTAIQRMEERGLVTTVMGEPRPERGGKARRLVALTERGAETLGDLVAEQRAMLGDLHAPLLGKA